MGFAANAFSRGKFHVRITKPTSFDSKKLFDFLASRIGNQLVDLLNLNFY